MEDESSSQSVFLYLVRFLNRILTGDNIRKQGFNGAVLCCLYFKDEETVSHLLLHCDFSFELWGFFFFLMGVSWIMPANP